MKLSPAGLALIEEFEGYMIKLPDGGCRSYQCRVGTDRAGEPIYDGKWTIGFGCTEGITEGMIWTRQQADDAFRAELAKHEKAVERLTTVDLNQNQFDALTSFSYNCGTSALQHSTLLKKVNDGDFEGAARQFASWNKSRGVVVSGLVRRRAAEAALFRKPAAPSEEPDMPKAVDTPPEVPVGSRKVVTANIGAFFTASTATTLLSISAADSFSYAEKLASLIKTYGVHLSVACLFFVTVGFALIKHFATQDHQDGRYVSSGDAK